jgi:hypothetical protein
MISFRPGTHYGTPACTQDVRREAEEREILPSHQEGLFLSAEKVYTSVIGSNLFVIDAPLR